MESRKIEIIEGDNARILKVEAYIFTHPADDMMEFGIHKTVVVKDIKDDTWTVTHVSTGCCIDKGYASMKQAHEDALSRLNEYLVTKEAPDALANFKAAISDVPPVNKVKLDIMYKNKK